MAHRLDDYSNSINSDLQSDYDAHSSKTEREEYEAIHCQRVQVAIARYADSPADVLERIALTCSAAFCAPLDEDDSPTPSADAGEA